MSTLKAPIIEMIAALSLAAIALSAVALFVPKAASGDSATWAGAVGTFLAFFAAISLANGQEKRRRQEALDLAGIVAAQVTGRIDAIGLAVSSILAPMAFAEGRDKINLSGLERLRALLTEQGGDALTAEIIHRLIPLPDKAAHRLARAVGLMHSCTVNIEVYTKSIGGGRSLWDAMNDKDRNGLANKWINVMSEARNHLEAADQQIRAAAAIDMPPPTWYET